MFKIPLSININMNFSHFASYNQSQIYQTYTKLIKLHKCINSKYKTKSGIKLSHQVLITQYIAPLSSCPFYILHK